MTKADWKSVCENFTLADGTFWPVPVTLDCEKAEADSVSVGEEIALEHEGVIYATMKVTEKFEMSEADKKWECEKVFKGEGEESEGENFWKIAPEDHPGVIMVMNQKDVNLAGPVKVLPRVSTRIATKAFT
jgi:sulfate adenylyltransferase